MKLFSTGILGINARNLLYIRPFNKKKATNLADHKLQSKIFFKNHQIPSANVYKVIHNKNELASFQFEDIAAKSFVIKPNRGFGGQGIKIITNKDQLLPEKKQELKDHIANILDGNFSLTSAPDIALIEQRLICYPELAAFCYKGLPDIRVIVHNLIPIMAMLRLPTKESDGKANYHAGGAIAGIDLATGKITHAVIHGKYVSVLPGQVTPIIGFPIPNWDQILLIASKAQLYSNLGYLAIDIVLNKKGDPLVLEMNARGGLAIQVANKARLRERLDRIQGLKITDPVKGVRIGKELFGSHKTSETLDDEIEELSGKEVLGTYETVTLLGKNNKDHQALALMDTSKIYTSVDKRLAQQLGLISAQYEEKGKTDFFRVTLGLGKKRKRTFVTIKDYSKQSYQVVVGRRNLRDALIDPFRGLPSSYLQAPGQISNTLEQEKEADQLLGEIYENFNFLHYLNPINVEEETAKWTENPEHLPQLTYRTLPDSYRSIKSELQTIPEFESDIGKLITKKAKEMLAQLTLLESIGSEEHLNYSRDLFRPLTALERMVMNKIMAHPVEAKPKIEPVLDAETIQSIFNQQLKQLGLSKWKAKLEKTSTTNVRVKSNHTIGIPENKKAAPYRVKQLIAHELMAHALTRDRGEKQQWHIFSYGFPQYIYTQEGLAVSHEIKATPEYRQTILYRTARDAFLVEEANKLTGKELMKLLLTLFSPSKAWQVFIRLKRGMTNTNLIGGSGRDAVYFIGLQQIEHLESIDKILYSGRVQVDELKIAMKYNSITSLDPPSFPFELAP